MVAVASAPTAIWFPPLVAMKEETNGFRRGYLPLGVKGKIVVSGDRGGREILPAACEALLGKISSTAVCRIERITVCCCGRSCQCVSLDQPSARARWKEGIRQGWWWWGSVWISSA